LRKPVGRLKPDPFFSVIIPTYNRWPLVEAAVGSVLAQTFTDYELIIADDGSSDDTLAGLYAAFGERFSVIKLPHCGNPGAVRNAAAVRACGRYLAFLDSDDLWHQDKLQRQYKQITEEAAEAAVYHTREVWLRDEKELSQTSQKHRSSGDIFADALIKCIIGPSTAVIRHTLFKKLGGFREDLEVAEDYEFWLRVLHEGPAAYIDKPLVIKREGGWENLSSKYETIEPFRIEGLTGLLYSDKITNVLKKEALRRELGRKTAIYTAGLFKRGRYNEAALFTQKLLRLLA
jgi:glycosyltransferase involved in cell wall biosynthesis